MADARFRDSIAWQKAMVLIKEVYTATGRFPKEEGLGPHEPIAARFCLHRKQYR
jgi:hypothetical protein